MHTFLLSSCRFCIFMKPFPLTIYLCSLIRVLLRYSVWKKKKKVLSFIWQCGNKEHLSTILVLFCVSWESFSTVCMYNKGERTSQAGTRGYVCYLVRSYRGRGRDVSFYMIFSQIQTFWYCISTCLANCKYSLGRFRVINLFVTVPQPSSCQLWAHCT